MTRLRIPFESAAPDADESPLDNESPDARAMRLAEKKARSLESQFADALIIGGDQTIADIWRRHLRQAAHPRKRRRPTAENARARPQLLHGDLRFQSAEIAAAESPYHSSRDDAPRRRRRNSPLCQMRAVAQLRRRGAIGRARHFSHPRNSRRRPHRSYRPAAHCAVRFAARGRNFASLTFPPLKKNSADLYKVILSQQWRTTL